MLILEQSSGIVFLRDGLELLHVGGSVARNGVLVARRIVHEDVGDVQAALLALLLESVGGGDGDTADGGVVLGVGPIHESGPP